MYLVKLKLSLHRGKLFPIHRLLTLWSSGISFFVAFAFLWPASFAKCWKRLRYNCIISLPMVSSPSANFVGLACLMVWSPMLALSTSIMSSNVSLSVSAKASQWRSLGVTLSCPGGIKKGRSQKFLLLRRISGTRIQYWFYVRTGGMTSMDSEGKKHTHYPLASVMTPMKPLTQWTPMLGTAEGREAYDKAFALSCRYSGG